MSISAEKIKQLFSPLIDENSIIIEQEKQANFINEPRKRFHKAASAIILPNNIEQLQKIVRLANNNNIPLIAQGGNSGLVGGQVPIGGDEIIISLSRLNRVREINIEKQYMVVEAGLILQQAQQIAKDNNLLFPLDIASKGSAQIGGVLATNAGGAKALSFGVARDLCLGIEAVLADGSLYNGLKYLKKDNSGYDLNNLLIGSEGTLAIISAAKLKLLKPPLSYETAIVGLDNVEKAYSLFCRLSEKFANRLVAFEIIPLFGIKILQKHQKMPHGLDIAQKNWYALIEVANYNSEGNYDLLDELEGAFNNGLIDENSLYAQSENEREQFWQMRELMSETQSLEGASIKHDISVPVEKIAILIERTIGEIAKLNKDIRPCPFGHMGDGNIHFNFSQPENFSPEEFFAMAKDIHQIVYNIVLDLGGSISAEHGIGQLKIDLLEKVKDKTALKMMKAIKMALDPNNILNRGKLLKM